MKDQHITRNHIYPEQLLDYPLLLYELCELIDWLFDAISWLVEFKLVKMLYHDQGGYFREYASSVSPEGFGIVLFNEGLILELRISLFYLSPDAIKQSDEAGGIRRLVLTFGAVEQSIVLGFEPLVPLLPQVARAASALSQISVLLKSLSFRSLRKPMSC